CSKFRSACLRSRLVQACCFCCYGFALARVGEKKSEAGPSLRRNRPKKPACRGSLTPSRPGGSGVLCPRTTPNEMDGPHLRLTRLRFVPGHAFSRAGNARKHDSAPHGGHYRQGLWILCLQPTL